MNKLVWDCTINESIPMPKEMEDFIKDIEAVCEKHCMTISHEDNGGAFEIETWKKGNISWLWCAHKNYQGGDKQGGK